MLILKDKKDIEKEVKKVNVELERLCKVEEEYTALEKKIKAFRKQYQRQD